MLHLPDFTAFTPSQFILLSHELMSHELPKQFKAVPILPLCKISKENFHCFQIDDQETGALPVERLVVAITPLKSGLTNVH